MFSESDNSPGFSSSTPQRETPTPPDHGQISQVGPYLLLAKLGQGGMGTVYKALHAHLKKVVAVKLLPPHRMDDADAVARFQQEMQAVGRLEHPNLVQATDAGEAGGVPFLVMEYVVGIDLAKLLKKHGPLPIPEACEIARQVAEGLQYISLQGLVHRDIKPSNLMLTKGGRVKILDLGLALLYQGRSSDERLTPSHQVLGTADYMAPEQGNSSPVDIRSDLYSLGCTLYKLLTGQAPFGSPPFDTFLKKLQAHAHLPVPPVTQFRPDVHPDLVQILERLLAKDPQQRFLLPALVAQNLAPLALGHNLAHLGETSAHLPPPPLPSLPEAPFASRETRPFHTPNLAAKPTGNKTWRRWITRKALLGVGSLGLGLVFLLVFLPAWLGPADTEGNKVEPAPALYQVGQLPPLVWHNLLLRLPKEIYRDKASREIRWQFDEKKEELWVSSDDDLLLGIGEVDRACYQVQIGLMQPTWMGGVGVFFGFQDWPGKGPGGKKVQLLELRPYLLRDDKRAFTFCRTHIFMEPGPAGKLLFQSKVLASMVVPRPVFAEQILEFHVENHGLRSVRWGGEVLKDLTAPALNQALTPADYQGAFGIICRRSSGVFRNSRFMLFPKE